MSRLSIRGARVITPGRDLGVTDVLIEDGRIAAVGARVDSASCPKRSCCTDTVPAASSLRGAVTAGLQIDAGGLIALPGFIDIHSHGRGGADFCDLTDAAFERIGRGKLADGVTGFLATGLARPEADLAELCRCVEKYKGRMVTGGLLADDVYAEIITDGVHLSDPMIRLIAKTKGPDRLMVITDAMCAAGEPDGIYSLGGLRVKVEKGKAALADVPYDPKAVVSNVAGSVALYPHCFKRYVKASGLPLEEAVKATSYNQCRSLGIPDRGEIAVGKIADIVLVDAELNPRFTIVNGEIKWHLST